MGWRDSYNALLELFPQVDVRLIKGAALEHGNDVGAAADFILNEVLDSLDVEQQPDAVHQGSSNSSQGLEQESTITGVQSMTATDSGSNPFIELSIEQESERWTSDGSDYTREDPGTLAHHSRDNTLTGTLKGSMEQDECEVLCASSSNGSLSSDTDSGPGILHGNQEQPQELMAKDPEGITNELSGPKESVQCVEGKLEHISGYQMVKEELTDISTGVPREEADEYKIEIERLLNKSKVPSVSCDSEDGHPKASGHSLTQEIVPREAVEYKIGVESLVDKCEVAPVVLDVEDDNTSTSNDTLVKESFPGVSEDGGLGEVGNRGLVDPKPVLEFFRMSHGRHGSESEVYNGVLENVEHRVDAEELVGLAVTPGSNYEGSNVNLLGSSMVEEMQLREEDPVIDLSILDSVNVPRSTYEDEAVALGDSLDSMLSIEKSFMRVNGIDGVDWESVHSNSIPLTRMKTLDDLVEEAKTDKEVLISSIEEIRELRLKTSQAEYVARQAKDEAARGGLDVLAKVDEMRQILSRAREANAVHAGEVYGEKAVLSTEARELHSRLVQVKAEKAKALSALNEIKASLQARIESANQEHEAAELEKVTKEVLAREVLAKQEALLAKVAQESRDLDAEAEVCTKLHEFLIDRGTIVDALQGEVAVLCEDADALKKDLDGMSLSCGGGYVHMLSRAGSDIFNSMGSRSGKFSEFPLQGLAQLEDGALSSSSNSGSFSQRRVAGIQKASSVKKSWSSLPSLLQALSGSQDLSNSSQSGHSSATANNSASSSRNALVVNSGEESQYLGIDVKYPSSPSSPTSPDVAQAEQELYEAQMAIFPGEELELDYSGSHNLDIFRSEKLNEPRAGTDEEDWHLLDPEILSKRSSGSFSSSSTGK